MDVMQRFARATLNKGGRIRSVTVLIRTLTSTTTNQMTTTTTMKIVLVCIVTLQICGTMYRAVCRHTAFAKRKCQSLHLWARISAEIGAPWNSTMVRTCADSKTALDVGNAGISDCKAVSSCATGLVLLFRQKRHWSACCCL